MTAYAPVPRSRAPRGHPLTRIVAFITLAGILMALMVVPISALDHVLRLVVSLKGEGGFFGLAEAAFLLLQAASALAALTAIIICRRRLDRKSVTSLGLSARRGWLYDIALGLFLGLGANVVNFVWLWELGYIDITTGTLPENAIPALLAVIYLVSLHALAALWEEISFRGYILQNLEVWRGPRVALIGSSLLFAAVHAPNPGFGPIPLVMLTLAGSFLGYAYLRTKSLWLPVSFHFAWNVSEGLIFGFPVSGLIGAGLFQAQVNGPTWLTGGPFGPEGGVTMAVPLLAALLGLRRWGRRRPR